MNQLLDRKTAGETPRFTAKQGQYLAFIWAYVRINDRAPGTRSHPRF
jgi:hypothetical protein